ncbi:hypothetical protein PybrP1_006209 [[Pythium] brassicae (nom. inval.)]|nr:hypothetical protein PybrP1_006209 [[Pythium] brassicae (nom. inval.)]
MTLALTPAIKQLRTLAPVAAVAVAAASLLFCMLSAKLGGRYTGGLAWPYLSDLVRDAPAYYVFALGALVVAVLLGLNWGFNFEFQSAVLLEPGNDAGAAPSRQPRLPAAATHLLRTNVALGALSNLGLILLALFSATSFPALHSAAAHGFLLLLSVAVFLNTFISYKMQKFVRSVTDPMAYTPNGVNLPPTPETLRLQKLQRTFHVQFVCAVAYFVAMLLYVPVGLAVAQAFKRLSMQELWNYEDDFVANQMRAIAQLGCVFTLLAYALSFAAHEYDDEFDRLASRGLAQSTHFYSLAVLPTPPPSATTSATTTTTTATANGAT